MVEDVVEPNKKQLQISVQSFSGSRKQTMLELPEEAICTRLLRNPFEVYNSPEKVNLTTKLSGFFFDENGGKIFARSDDKTVIYLPVPNSPNAAPGHPRQYRLQNQNALLLAAGRLGKSVATVALNETGHLHLDYPKFGNFRLPSGNYLIENAEVFLPSDDKTLLPVFNLRFPNSPFFQAAFLDAKNNLFLLNKADNLGSGLVGRAFLIATDVLGAVRTENRFVFVGCEAAASKTLQIVSYGEKTERRDSPLTQLSQAFFGRGIGIAHQHFGLLALGDTENHFVIIKNGEEKYIDATPSSEVVGVYYDPSFAAEVGLVELQEDRRTLNFNVGRKYGKQIFISGEEIEKIVFSHRSPVCAYQTVSGKIIIFSLTHRVPTGSFGD